MKKILVFTIAEAAMNLARHFNLKNDDSVIIEAKVPVAALESQNLLKPFDFMKEIDSILNSESAKEIATLNERNQILQGDLEYYRQENARLKELTAPKPIHSLETLRSEAQTLMRASMIAAEGRGTTQNKIHAIKAFRTLTGDGLKESKDMIERLFPSRIPTY